MQFFNRYNKNSEYFFANYTKRSCCPYKDEDYACMTNMTNTKLDINVTSNSWEFRKTIIIMMTKHFDIFF